MISGTWSGCELDCAALTDAAQVRMQDGQAALDTEFGRLIDSRIEYEDVTDLQRGNVRNADCGAADNQLGEPGQAMKGSSVGAAEPRQVLR